MLTRTLRRTPLSLALGLTALPVALALGYLALYLYIAAERVAYPYELEWMEGGVVDHVARVLAGQALYGPPSIDFTPYIYSPFYYYLASVPAKLLGPSLPVLRAVSLVATLTSFLLLYLLVVRETGSRAGGLVTAGLFAASYPLSGAWFEIARVDSTALSLCLGGALLWRHGARAAPLFAGGLLLALAHFTKQSFALPGAALALWLVAMHRSRALLGLGTGALVALGLFVIHDLRTHGWYRYYTVELPGLHSIYWAGWGLFWREFFLTPLWAGVPLGLAGIGLLARRAERRWAAPSFHLLFGTSLVAMSVISLMHSGAYCNVTMPAHAAVALAVGLGVGQAVKLARSALGPFTPRRFFGATLLCALALVQLGWLRYDPRPHLPTAEDRAAGARLLAALAEIPGEVYIPNHAHLAALVGKPSHAQWFALQDIYRSRDRQRGEQVLAELRRTLESGRFAAVVLDGCGGPPRLGPVALDGYVVERDVLARQPGLWTRTGLHTRPTCIWVKRP